jgi:MoaA/NifB/PqqE/SkfB family radical SAM enzyme
MIRSNDVKSVHIELSSYCNAACPNCPRNFYGGNLREGVVPSTMSYDDFVNIFPIEWWKGKNKVLFCGNYGDPIMSIHLVDIIEYIKKCNSDIEIKINTNGGIQTAKWWKRLGKLSNTLGNIIVTFSIDGLEDTNHIYRQNVKWNKLKENFQSYIETGGNAKWDFLVFKHNQHQIDEAKELSNKWGFTDFIVKRPIGFNDNNNIGNDSVMPVMDKNNNLSYYIYESDNYKMRINDSHTEQVVDENTNSGTRKILLESSGGVTIQELYESLIEENSGSLKKSIKHDIDCFTINTSEIYVSSEGNVYPCCWTGLSSQNVGYGMEHSMRKWIEERGYDINAKNSSINAIVDSGFFEEIKRTWSKPENLGRLQVCSTICSAKCSVMSQLVVS